jgi:hypothetical protein
LIVEVFELLYKKVGHPLAREWIEEICKLLYCQDPHPPYDFGHLISAESIGVGTFRWARVYVDEDPQAIANSSPDSSQTCVVALAPDLLSQLSKHFVEMPDIHSQYADNSIQCIPTYINKSIKSFCIDTPNMSKTYNDTVIKRACQFLLHINDSIEGLLQPDPQGRVTGSRPLPKVETVHESPGDSAPPGTTVITIDNSALPPDISPASTSANVEVSEIQQRDSPDDDFPTTSNVTFNIAGDPPIQPTTGPEPALSDSTATGSHASIKQSIPDHGPTKLPAEPDPGALRWRLDALDPRQNPSPTKFVDTHDIDKVLMT